MAHLCQCLPVKLAKKLIWQRVIAMTNGNELCSHPWTTMDREIFISQGSETEMEEKVRFNNHIQLHKELLYLLQIYRLVFVL